MAQEGQTAKDRKELALYVDDFVNYERIKWSRDLKLKLLRGVALEFTPTAIRESLYRPFTKQMLYYRAGFVDRTGPAGRWFPEDRDRQDNLLILIPTDGARTLLLASQAT